MVWSVFIRNRIVWLCALTAWFSGFSALHAETPASEQGEQKYWAYRAVTRPEVPAVRNAGLARTPVDAFVLKHLEAKNLSFNLPAEPRDLLRRITFDLTGLPPTPDEARAFLTDIADSGIDLAYERVVDRLLASPHHGERWGRLWLDIVRYSDTAGYNADPVRPLAYQYRDYVIDAFNNDTPYDRFIQEQLAGDELFPERAEALIATGYLRLGPDESNASNVELARQDQLNELTGNVGAVFLAQSIACAQCHDHKFDAITQEDYFRLQAFFAGVIPVDRVPVAQPDAILTYEQQLQAWLVETAELRHELRQLEILAQTRAAADKRVKFPAVVLKAIDTPKEERTALQHQLSFYSERQIDVKEAALLKALKPEERERQSALQQALKDREATKPQPPGQMAAMAAVDGRETPKTFLLGGGSYNKPREELQPGFPVALDVTKPYVAPIKAPREGVPGRRSTLAAWLGSPTNPLTARVIANRVWQSHFGLGLVENANDFGVQTAAPELPQLLDWLAAELVTPTESVGTPWTLKRLHRLIVLSNVYRQSSRHVTDGIADQTPFAWQHYPRRRLDAESIRDAFLSVSGVLNSKLHGPPVLPALPPKYSGREAWPVSSEKSDQQRRSVYIMAKRNLPYPLLQAFDLPDMHESCARRMETTTAPQALMLFHSELVVGYAQAFAGRLLLDNPEAEPRQAIEEAWQLAFNRLPTSEETAAATEFLVAQELAAEEKSQIASGLLPRPYPKFLDSHKALALVDLCHALLNANEFLFLD